MEFHLRKIGPVMKIKVLEKPDDCQKKVWVAGRATSCEIFTRSKFASRKHFSITYRDDKYFIRDLRSANGTYLNDQKVRGEQLLTLGSVISVGVPSTMQKSKECIIFVFELHTKETSAEQSISQREDEGEDDEIVILEESSSKSKANNEVEIPKTKSDEPQTVDKKEDSQQNSVEHKEASTSKRKSVLDTKVGSSSVDRTIPNDFSNFTKTVEDVRKSTGGTTNSCDKGPGEDINVKLMPEKKAPGNGETVGLNELPQTSTEGSGAVASCSKTNEPRAEDENDMEIDCSMELDMMDVNSILDAIDIVLKENGLDYDKGNGEVREKRNDDREKRNGEGHEKRNGEGHDKRNGEVHEKRNGEVNRKRNGEVHEKRNGEVNKKRNAEDHEKRNGEVHNKRNDEVHEKRNGEVQEKRNAEVHKKRNAEDHEKRNGEVHEKRNGEVHNKRNGEYHEKRNGEVNKKRNAEDHEKRNGEVHKKRNAEDHEKRNGEVNKKRNAEDHEKRNGEVQEKRNADVHNKRNGEVHEKRNGEVHNKRNAEDHEKRNGEVNKKRNAEDHEKRNGEVHENRNGEVQEKRNAEVQKKRNYEDHEKRNSEVNKKRNGQDPEKRNSEVHEKRNGENLNEGDKRAYEALTQVQASMEDDESNAAGYSMTEELIEIRESEEEEEEWFMNLRKIHFNRSDEFDEDEDESDVIFLEKISKAGRSHNDSELISNLCKTGNDLTETDTKWVYRLLKIKQESGSSQVENLLRNAHSGRIGGKTEIKNNGRDEPHSAVNDYSSRMAQASLAQNPRDISDCLVKLHKLSPGQPSKAVQKTTPDVASSETVRVQSTTRTEHNRTEDVMSKAPLIPRISGRNVWFNMEPDVRFLEMSTKLLPVENGRVRFSNIFYNICNWNTRWLEECRAVSHAKDPPNICPEPMTFIPNRFENHAEYMSAFIPLLLLNLWHKVKDNWIKSERVAYRQLLSCDSQIEHHSKLLDAYQCTGVVQDMAGHRQLVREGHLVMLKVHLKRDAGLENYSKNYGYVVFGFVEGKSYEWLGSNRKDIHPALQKKFAQITGPLYLTKLSILVKKRQDFKIDKDKLMYLTVIQNISSELRVFRGICSLPESQLCAAILNPLKSRFTLPKPPKMMKMVFRGPLDSVQRSLVNKMTYACVTTSHFLYSVHGAAGTGKGQVIVALILQLLYGEEFRNFDRPKIIYCAPSSGPLDEVASKLKLWRENIAEPSRFKLVRVGPIKEIRPDIREFSVSTIVQEMFSSEFLQLLIVPQMHPWPSPVAAPPPEGRPPRPFWEPLPHGKVRVKIGAKRKVIDDAEEMEREIIEEADVVCTTCWSSGTSKMIAAFKKCLERQKSRRVVCIIDEAMQSTEYESIMPLLLGVTHMFLFGDTCQLEPAASVERSHFLGVDRSLFWRIYQNFGNIPDPISPYSFLKIQHRMNPILSRFPSVGFYQYKMENSGWSFTHTIANLRNYLFFLDLSEEEQETRDGNKEESGKENVEGNKEEDGRKNIRQKQIILQLIKTITYITRSFSRAVEIAIITCDAKQSEALTAFVPKDVFPEVEINHLHRFQGREADVVIFHYDGSRLLNSQIALALTRAKCSLFIVASEKSVGKNACIQKVRSDAEERYAVRFVPEEMRLDGLAPLLLT